MTNTRPLTQDDLKAAAYFAVGVTSEGSIGGHDVSYRLSFAGNVAGDGRMSPVGNSGYSFGTLQIDLGANPAVARDMLDHYQQWADGEPDRAALHLTPDAYASTLHALQRNGRAMRAAEAHDIDRTDINRFLGSDVGRAFVHGLDRQHAEAITRVDRTVGNHDSALERLERTELYRNATDDDQARLAGILMKLQNQSGERYTPRLLERIERHELGSAVDVKAAVDGLLPNQANGNPDYVQSGADNTLRGIALFNTLRAAERGNPLAIAWNSVTSDPLAGPSHARPAGTCSAESGLKYDTIRSLFLTPEASQRLVHALDHGATLAEGDPALHHGRRHAGFYADGGNFVHWNANGQGVACIGGHWRSVDPEHLHRAVQRDGSVDLTLTENGRTTTLLHVDRHARTTGPAAREPEPAAHPAPAPMHPDGLGQRRFARLDRRVRAPHEGDGHP
ncbi:hypothetical protein FW784_12765, partial [Lysobacter lacus]